MSIFDQDRVGKSVLCKVRHNETNEVKQGYVRWVDAYTDRVIKRLESVGLGWLSGPWTVLEVDVPFEAPAFGTQENA